MKEIEKLEISRCESGLWGATRQGVIVIPFIYDEVSFIDGDYYCRIWEDYDLRTVDGQVTDSSVSRRYWVSDHDIRDMFMPICRRGLDSVPPEEIDGMFKIYHNGYFGVTDSAEETILPAIYDDVVIWRKCDVIYARKGIEHFYFNRKGVRILTKFQIPPDKQWTEPYYIGELQNDNALETMEFVNGLIDEQCCFCYGKPTRLDRILKTSVESMLRHGCDIKPFSKDAFYWFNHKSNYIYRAYIAHGKSIDECIGQLKKMECYDSTWYYIDKLTAGPNYHGNVNADLNKLHLEASEPARELFEDLHSRESGEEYKECEALWYGGIGTDTDLDDGLTVFHIEYYWELPPNSENS